MSKISFLKKVHKYFIDLTADSINRPKYHAMPGFGGRAYQPTQSGIFDTVKHYGA